MKTTTEETPVTCTVTHAMGRCGKPAVVTFTTTAGETFAECAEHATGPMGHGTTRVEAAPFEIGERVTVEHIGVAKIGRITKVGRTRVTVEVTVGRGTTARTKEITRGFAEVRKAGF